MGDVPRTYVRTVRTNEQMTHARGLPRLTGNCSRAAPLPTSWFDTRWCVPRLSRSSLKRAHHLSFSVYSPLYSLVCISVSLFLSFSGTLIRSTRAPGTPLSFPPCRPRGLSSCRAVISYFSTLTCTTLCFRTVSYPFRTLNVYIFSISRSKGRAKSTTKYR